MAFFGAVSVSIMAPATETVNSEGTPCYELKGINMASSPGVPVILMVPTGTENATFLKALSEKTTDGSTVRVLATGVLQPVLAEKNKQEGTINKPSKIILWVGAARRLRADLNLDPEQCSVFGNGYASETTDFEDKSIRKPELRISSGTESLKEEGTYCSMLNVQGTQATGLDEFCMQVEDGREVYFQGNLHRSAGEYNGKEYDNLKCELSFIQETDRIKKKGGGRKPKAQSMRSQLNDSFEESNSSPTQTMSATELSAQANISLADF
jgi:hypothetical protein